MRYRFSDRTLEMMYTTGVRPARYGPDVMKSFLRAIALIDGVKKDNELYQYKGLRYEKLKGDRAGERSIRLNDQWRLILRPETDQQGNFLWIVEIVDYH